jgi:hypothetical protein
METAPDWSEIATRSPEITENSAETTTRSRKTPVAAPSVGGNLHEINGLR